MRQQVRKIEFSTETNSYDIPEGWEIDKFLDVTGNYAIVVLFRHETTEEYNRRTGIATVTTNYGGTPVTAPRFDNTTGTWRY